MLNQNIWKINILTNSQTGGEIRKNGKYKQLLAPTHTNLGNRENISDY